MSYFYERDLGHDGVLQGDVFKVGALCDDIFLENEKWAVVITADCDIEKKKMGNTFTVLPIILAEDYLRDIWLVEVFNREKEELIEKAVEIINNSGISSIKGCNSITNESMDTWLNEEPIESIFKLLELDMEDKKIIEVSEKLSIVLDDVTMTNFFSLRKHQKRTEKKIKKEIMEAIKKCRDEFYFIPDIPCSESIGLMIKLRSIRAIHESRVVINELGARLYQDDQRKTLIRVGRFSDYLRYSISQNFALLFSRIGMPSQFESDNNVSIELISNSIWGKHNGL